MSQFDKPIGPITLREEILSELRITGGPMLRSALRQRCKLALTDDAFSQAFGMLVIDGEVSLFAGTGHRAIYQLSEKAKADVDVPRASATWGRRETTKPSNWARGERAERQYQEAGSRRARIEQVMEEDGGWRPASDVAELAGLPIGKVSYLLPSMVNEGVLVRHGTNPNVRYRLARLASDGQLPDESQVSARKQRSANRLAAVKASVLAYLADNQSRSAQEIVKGARITWGDKQASLKALREEGLVVTTGLRSDCRYRLAGAPAPKRAEAKPFYIKDRAAVLKVPPPDDDGLVVRVKLDRAEVDPFFAFMRKLRSGAAGASA